MAQFRKDTHQYLGDGRTIFEVVMLADQYGNLVGPANPSGAAIDAFGRSRTSTPYTLFDSFHRYQDNGKISQANTATANSTHNANAGLIEMNVDTTNGAYIYRESSRVFSYQPGKSLQTLQSFTMAPKKTGLRQRIGLFGVQNGVYLEQSDEIYFVIRSYSSGGVVNTRIPQSQWNTDKMDGTGPSLKTLDMTKSQIFTTDIEWLGVGTVRVGFVIDGQFIICHKFHHANISVGTYMTTANLPVRAELENTAGTASNSTMQIICTSIISEGGYEPRGRARTAGQAANTSYTLTTAGVWYPVVSLRLKSGRLDGVVLPKNFALLGLTGNGSRLRYKITAGAAITSGTWVDAGSDSSVEYNITGTAMTGGNDLTSGFQAINNQGSVALSTTGDYFRYQLERNSFTSTAATFTLAVQGAGAADTCIGSIDWEETT